MTHRIVFLSILSFCTMTLYSETLVDNVRKLTSLTYEALMEAQSRVERLGYDRKHCNNRNCHERKYNSGQAYEIIKKFHYDAILLYKNVGRADLRSFMPSLEKDVVLVEASYLSLRGEYNYGNDPLFDCWYDGRKVIRDIRLQIGW